MAPRGSSTSAKKPARKSSTSAARTRSSSSGRTTTIASSPKKDVPSSSSSPSKQQQQQQTQQKKEIDPVYEDPRHAAEQHRFQFVHSPQDHDVRKRQILEKYGDKVRALMVIEPRTKWDVFLLVGLQVLASVLFRNADWPVFIVMAYFCGTMMTHALFLAIHEITHYTVFKTPWLNSLLAMIANIPIVFPYAMMFRDYHADHHRYLGWDEVDTDLPTTLELKLFDSFPGRLFFVTFQIFFYALRPMMVMFKPMRIEHWINWAVVFGCDYIWYRLWGPNTLLFMALSLALSGAPSPTSGHFISEHYTVWSPSKRQETFSYYGPWNFFTFNVGYHNEHHDFPNIPWTKLPELRKIAPEFYEPLVQPPSWWSTTKQFLLNGNCGIFNRVKREHECRKRGKLTLTDKEPNPDLCSMIPENVQRQFSAKI